MKSDCRSCGTNHERTARFCGECGEAISEVGNGPTRVLTPDAIRRLAGSRSDYYIRAFFRMFPAGAVGLKPSWNWAAFFGGVFWMFYRGLFLEALALLSLELLFAFAHLPLWPALLIGQGVFGNAIYFLALERRARRTTPVAA